MSSTLEDLRQSHEDIETLKHLASCALQSRTSIPVSHPRLAKLSHPLPTPRSAEHLAHDLVRLVAEKSSNLSSAYDSSADALPRALADLSAVDPLSAFYARLRDLRDAHRAAVLDSSALRAVPTEAERDAALLHLAHRPVAFSGEEGNGRYLDLMAHYMAYLNIIPAGKNDAGTRVEYYEYVDTVVTDFDSVPPSGRNSHAYAKYLTDVLAYCVDFACRAHPLDRVEEHVDAARERVKNSVEERLKSIAEKTPSAQAMLDELGADGVKRELLTLGLKCGGRPADRAGRLLKAAREGNYGERVVLEGVVQFAVDELLAEEREATVANVRKKLSLSYAEIEAERIADEAVAEGALERAKGGAEAEEVESTLYNPKDVPLGWDGKPIPYWMYKLHGLNHEFKCEICGNATYKGPRAFERHFTDSQHVQGLRCLGIGYSKAFMMITRIEDANKLNEKLKRESEEAAFDEDADMEFEDQEGNVLNKKTYTDLVRQGLL